MTTSSAAIAVGMKAPIMARARKVTNALALRNKGTIAVFGCAPPVPAGLLVVPALLACCAGTAAID